MKSPTLLQIVVSNANRAAMYAEAWSYTHTHTYAPRVLDMGGRVLGVRGRIARKWAARR